VWGGGGDWYGAGYKVVHVYLPKNKQDYLVFRTMLALLFGKGIELKWKMYIKMCFETLGNNVSILDKHVPEN
jgi:hypothetical protein